MDRQAPVWVTNASTKDELKFKFTKYTMKKKNLPDRRINKAHKKEYLGSLELLIESDRDWDMGIYKNIKTTKK